MALHFGLKSGWLLLVKTKKDEYVGWAKYKGRNIRQLAGLPKTVLCDVDQLFPSPLLLLKETMLAAGWTIVA